MDLSIGIYASVLVVLALISGTQSSQLYLQPTKADHGYFTGESFFITCFTTDETIDKLTWTDVEGNSIFEDEERRIHTQKAMGAQQGLRLVFTNVEKRDAGKYTCSDDLDSVSFELNVYRAISFGDTPVEQHVVEGETGIVTCSVHSDPRPMVHWSFNGSKITKSHKYKIMENHNLQIHNISRNDAGHYKCKVFVITPLATSMKELDITLRVHYAPEIVGEHRVVSYASIGLAKNLSCTISAEPAPLFQWLWDDRIIKNDSKTTIFNSEFTSVLQLLVEKDDDFGEYICRGSNALGDEEVAIELKEGDTPEPPLLSVESEQQGIVKLNIQVQDYDTSEEFKVTGFKVEYILASETWDMANIIEFDLDEPYVLKNMSFNSEYIIRAAAQNAAGYGHFSGEVSYKTQVLENAPVIASASSIIASSLVLVISIVFFWLF